VDETERVGGFDEDFKINWGNRLGSTKSVQLDAGSDFEERDRYEWVVESRNRYSLTVAMKNVAGRATTERLFQRR